MDETDKELIPYMAVSLLEGASIQVLVDGKGFDADSYFAYAEEMVLEQIRIAMEKRERNFNPIFWELYYVDTAFLYTSV